MFSFSRSHPPSQSHISLLADFMTSQWCCVIHLSFQPPFTASRQLIGGLHDFTVVVCYLSLVPPPLQSHVSLLAVFMTSQRHCVFFLSFSPPFTESHQLIGGLHDFTVVLCYPSLFPTPLYSITSAYWRSL